MNIFYRRHFESDFIILSVRWYCKYGISYRDLEEMLSERGVKADHTTIYRWVQHYSPIILKRLKSKWKPKISKRFYVDETYIKVKGKWTYLYRAINENSHTIDFYLSENRNTESARRFLSKALKGLEESGKPEIINTDKAPTYKKAISILKSTKECPELLVHRQVKYLNNGIESDHGKLKRLINPTLGFKSMKSAENTIKGFEIMRMFKKGQLDAYTGKYGGGIAGEVGLITSRPPAKVKI